MSSLISIFRHNFQNFRRCKLKEVNMSNVYVVNLFIMPDKSPYYPKDHQYNLDYNYRIF
jgi:hypothetical protein